MGGSGSRSSPTGLKHNILEIFNNVGIQANSNAHFIWVMFYNRASLTLAEIFTHRMTTGNTARFLSGRLFERAGTSRSSGPDPFPAGARALQDEPSDNEY